MAKFLIRNSALPAGCEAVDFPSGDLPRSQSARGVGGESYTPWAVTTAGEQVVYAKTGEHLSWNAGGDRRGVALKPYDSSVSQNRRRLAESDLGLYALHYPALTKTAVRSVNLAIKFYLTKHWWENQTKTKDLIFKEIGHYFYTDKGQGFGRISDAHKDAVGKDGVWEGIIHTLDTGRLDQLMAIHDAVGRKILPVLGGPQLNTYNTWGPILRQDWFDDASRRGRVAAPTRAATTTVGGIARSTQAGSVQPVQQSRARGVDMFQRDLDRRRDPAADAYYDDVDLYHLLFGAGISGTTGTLLQAAFAFNKGALQGEALKQYTLAIIGYLVGGGMHSFHESLAVAQKAGVPYTIGSYIPSLPQSFLASPVFRDWKQNYYDVVALGRTHWRFNSARLPSHANSRLVWVSSPPPRGRGAH